MGVHDIAPSMNYLADKLSRYLILTTSRLPPPAMPGTGGQAPGVGFSAFASPACAGRLTAFLHGKN